MPEKELTNPSGPPSLGISHLMVWTAFTAVVLTVFLAISPPEEDTVGLERMWLYGVRFAYSIIYGAALTGMMIFVRWIVTAKSFAVLQPGHWLLMLVAIGAMIDGAVAIVIKWFVEPNWWRHSNAGFELWLLHQVVGYGAAVFVGIAMVILSRVERGWRLAFAGFVVLFGVECALSLITFLVERRTLRWDTPWYLPHAGISVGGAIFTLIAFALIIVDHRCGIQRDWLHWTGLAVALALAVNEWERFVRVVLLAD